MATQTAAALIADRAAALRLQLLLLGAGLLLGLLGLLPLIRSGCGPAP